LFTDKCSIS